MIWIGEDTDDSDKGGGAGKTLFFKIIGEVRVVKILPGKTWDALSQFAFQQIDLGTDLVVLEDLPPNFKLEHLYNPITEGMVIEKKNKQALTVPYEFSPKIGATSNYTPDKAAEHARRRIRELLVTKYFTDDNPPDKELGGLFFSDAWTNTDWQLFYNLCFSCIQTYIVGGIHQFKTTENVKIKEVKIKYSREFLAYMDDHIKECSGKWLSKSEIYEEFLSHSSQTTKEYSQKKFNNACEFWAKTMGYEFLSKRSKARGGERDKQFCIFVKQGAEVPEMTQTVMPF
jgi:hypothetical protein